MTLHYTGETVSDAVKAVITGLAKRPSLFAQDNCRKRKTSKKRC